MKGVGKFLAWTVLGIVFGTAVGILRRKLPFGGMTDALFAGMIAAPSMVMFLLLMDYITELFGWALLGFVIGAVFLYLVASYTEQSVESVGVEVNLTVRRALNGGMIGAVLMTWFGAGWSVFRGNSNNGIFGLLFSLIGGAFCGILVWFVGQSIEGQLITVDWLGGYNAWRVGESLAGIPIGILAGLVATQLIFPEEVVKQNN